MSKLYNDFNAISHGEQKPGFNEDLWKNHVEKSVTVTDEEQLILNCFFRFNLAIRVIQNS